MERLPDDYQLRYEEFDDRFRDARNLCSQHSTIRWLAAGWVLREPMDTVKLDQILDDVRTVNYDKKLGISKKFAQKRALEAIGTRAMHSMVQLKDSQVLVPDLATAQLAADKLAKGGMLWRRESKKLTQKIDIEILYSAAKL